MPAWHAQLLVGIFWPSMMKLRSQYVPENIRATILNLFRVPLNLFVCLILYNVCSAAHHPCMLYEDACYNILSPSYTCLAPWNRDWLSAITSMLVCGMRRWHRCRCQSCLPPAPSSWLQRSCASTASCCSASGHACKTPSSGACPMAQSCEAIWVDSSIYVSDVQVQ